jgi:hypothetical protein
MLQPTAQACVNEALRQFGYDAASVPIGTSPARLELRAAPNPFSGTTELSFVLPQSEVVKLRIFDVEGRLVRSLVEGELEAGPHRFDWDGRSANGDRVGSSVYYGALQVGDRWASRRISVLR